MGLTLSYETSLPADCSEADVLDRLTALRARALALPFEAVSDIVRFDERSLTDVPLLRGLAFESLAHVVQLNAAFHRDTLYRDWLGLGEEDEYEVVDAHTRRYRPIEAPHHVETSVIGFAIAPGRGSEPASFALTRLSGPEITTRWSCECFCKTQYASMLGDEHLLRCHGSLVALLDAAVELGFEVEVHDEAGYWESRDAQQLIESVAAMNRIVAGFAGALTDAVREAGADSRRISGAIFEHPDFERLETEVRTRDATD